MDFIKNWIFSICGASMASSIVKLIFNGSKMSKSVNIFLSLFLMFYMISPFAGDKVNDIVQTSGGVDDKKIYSDCRYNDFFESAIESVCVEENCRIISFEIETEEQYGEVIVNCVSVIIDDKDKCETVKNKINEKFGFEVNVS